MDFPSTARAPRYCQIGPKIYFVEPMSLYKHATLLQWLDDVIPGRDERDMPPNIKSQEAEDALASPTGQTLLIWLALKDHGVDFNQAGEISDVITDIERYVLTRALMTARRATQDPNPNGKSLSQTWCGKGMARLIRDIGYHETMALTMDQFEWLIKDGEIEGDPEQSEKALRARMDNWARNDLPKVMAMIAEQEATV